ncbi:hypothetical protein ACQP2T_52245 [Nonomuraea sp. CA-143628]|uniref:hypothetical protein n=1 Tax=Nonomuraea sp. CA-143628 TaxID=3239997 RepID=UPI003D8FFA4E
MTRGKALLAAVLVTAATTAATPATTQQPAKQSTQQSTQQPTQQPTKQPGSVTLITGDRVTVTGQGYRVQPGPGREVLFSRQMRDGHLYVIPSDALPLIAQDVLDRRLFDVTQLLEWHYGDADTPDIPVISQGFSSQGQVRRLAALGMSAARLPKANAAKTWRDLTQARTLAAGKTKLWLDGRMELSLTVDGKRYLNLADTPVTVSADRQVTVDTRQGRPTRITIDDPSAQLQDGFDYELVNGAWSTGGSIGRIDANSQLFVVPSSQAGLTYSLTTTWLSKDQKPSPYVYDLVDRRTGGLPEDPSRAFKQRDLAKVTATYRGPRESGTPKLGESSRFSPGSNLRSPVGEIPLPGTLVQYLTPGVTYESGLQVGDALMFGGSREAKRGESRGEVWNTAVVGP